jgi:two-component system, cell cycle response regulator
MRTGNRKANILVIDDNPDVLGMLERGLYHDYNVVAISQPEKASDIVKSDDIDLVITDIMMSPVSGFEILRRVKEVNEIIEVILLTGEAPDKIKPAVSAMQSGAHDYLLKPVNLRELKEAIRSALGKQQLRMEKKQLLLELVRMRDTDCVTGLSNQRSFFSQFSEEFQRSLRYQRTLGCVFLDVDKFKAINQRYGHFRGDQVLERIGNVLIKHTRGSDITCRYGGDEFVVVMPEADQQGARGLAEKLRQLIATELYNFADQPLKVTVSLGVSVYEVGSPQSAESLLSAADAALLSAKRAGGDCVVFKDIDAPAIQDIVPQTVSV